MRAAPGMPKKGGVSYYVVALDPPSGKLNNQTLVVTVIAYVGNRCQQRLKLHGETRNQRHDGRAV